MKKLTVLLLIASLGFVSCGPKRYKCGAYRRCETQKAPVQQENTTVAEAVYTSESAL